MEGRAVQAVVAVRHKGCSLREWWMAVEILPESGMSRRSEIEAMLAGR